MFHRWVPGTGSERVPAPKLPIRLVRSFCCAVSVPAGPLTLRAVAQLVASKLAVSQPGSSSRES